MAADDGRPTWLLVLALLVWAAAQYGLSGWALRDLFRRPTVRGDSKLVWAFLILAVPILGALAYAVNGPTSFLPRPAATPLPRPTTPTMPKARLRTRARSADRNGRGRRAS